MRERKGCRLIEAEVGDCLKEVCAENSELAPYHNNYSSTMSQLFVCFVSATLSPLCNTFLTKYQNLNRPNIVGGSNFSPIMWTQNNGLKNGDRICCQIRLVLNQMFQIFSSHGSSWLQQPCLPLRLEISGRSWTWTWIPRSTQSHLSRLVSFRAPNNPHKVRLSQST